MNGAFGGASTYSTGRDGGFGGGGAGGYRHSSYNYFWGGAGGILLEENFTLDFEDSLRRIQRRGSSLS